jgi:hypothetical protein
MVGRINAPLSGNTLQAFIDKAAKASTSTIPPQAPLGGVLSVNGTVIPSLNGNVFDPSILTKLGSNSTSGVWGMAGGGPPSSYNWAPSISSDAIALLQLLQVLDTLLVDLLAPFFEALSPSGARFGLYPNTIVSAIGTFTAQTQIHRSTATDSLSHYGKPQAGTCSMSTSGGNSTAPDLLSSAHALVLLSVGALIDGISRTAASDPWLIPALASALGAKTRMAGLLDMMQGRPATSAVREAALPSSLAYSYAVNRWVPGCTAVQGKTWPPLKVVPLPVVEQKITSVNVTVDASWKSSNNQGLWVAWAGSWGGVQYSSVGDDGTTVVPASTYGWVWAVLVNKGDGKLSDLEGITVAGPALVWVGQPGGESM